MKSKWARGSGLGARGNGPQPSAQSPQRRLQWLSIFVGWLWYADAAWADATVHGRVWLPEPLSTVAPAIDQLFYVVLWITGIVFVLVEGTLVVFLLRYRRRPGQPAAYLHGNHLVEIIWTIIPALILIYLAFHSQRVWARVRGTPPPADLEIEVTAEQFAWNIRYVGADGTLNTADDVTTINQLHLPVHHTVLVHLKSKDVIHSFFVPQFRLKQDAVPGLTGRVWVEAVKEGQIELVCAELCGLGHYRMRGFVTIESPEAFAAWMGEQIQALEPAQPPPAEPATPAQPSEPHA